MAEIGAEFVAAAVALDAVLQRFEDLECRRLSGVWLRYEHESVAEVVLDFGDLFLAAVAEEDYDTLKIEIRSGQALTAFTDASGIAPWNLYLGQGFSWGWLTMDQKGYVDGVLLGFGDDIYPKIVLNVIASEIKVGTITF